MAGEGAAMEQSGGEIEGAGRSSGAKWRRNRGGGSSSGAKWSNGAKQSGCGAKQSRNEAAVVQNRAAME